MKCIAACVASYLVLAVYGNAFAGDSTYSPADVSPAAPASGISDAEILQAGGVDIPSGIPYRIICNPGSYPALMTLAQGSQSVGKYWYSSGSNYLSFSSSTLLWVNANVGMSCRKNGVFVSLDGVTLDTLDAH